MFYTQSFFFYFLTQSIYYYSVSEAEMLGSQFDNFSCRDLLAMPEQELMSFLSFYSTSVQQMSSNSGPSGN